MAFESTPNQSFLGSSTDDDFATLDSMAFTGAKPQFGMNTATPSTSGSAFGGSNHDTTGRIGDGREGGFTGVSESLFDRIRARTAEQQKQSLSAQSSQLSSQQQQPQPSIQEAAQSSQQAPFVPQQPTSESTMEYEKDLIGMGNNNNAFDTAVSGVGTGAPTQNNQTNTAMSSSNETTYSFSASAGEDFSQAVNAAPQVPQYGRSRDDPYYAATSNQHQHPASIQDKAGMALAQTGETVKSLFGAGLSGAQAFGAMAQSKMAGGGHAAAAGGERSYNNNFLLRDETLEEGNNMMNHTAPMSQPPPPVTAAVASGSGVSGQAYSMFSYGKTFCEDLFGFVMQLPLWGKGLVAVVLLLVVYALFG